MCMQLPRTRIILKFYSIIWEKEAYNKEQASALSGKGKGKCGAYILIDKCLYKEALVTRKINLMLNGAPQYSLLLIMKKRHQY